MISPIKILRKSMCLAYSLFSPERWQTNYHFSFAFDGAELIGIGQNDPKKVSGKAMRIANLFSNNHFRTFPFLHSETDLIGRMWGKRHIDRKITVVNIRLNRHGRLKNSKPCSNCQKILDVLDVTNIIWSNTLNGFSGYKLESNVQFEQIGV